jgi:hypothetical protein
MSQKLNSLDLVEQILQDARASTKEASLKKSATDPSDPTSHPVMKSEDGTQPAREGSRSAENEADVRKALGNQGITGQSDANSADQSKPTDTIGTIKQDSTELKGNAKEPKSEKDLPPESKGHPSNVTGKYASLREKGASILQKFAAAPVKEKEEKPDMSKLKGKDSSQPPAMKPPIKAAELNELEKDAQLKLAAAQKHEDDATAGYMAAEMLVNALGFGKQAEEQEAMAQATITNIVKVAYDDAQGVAEYLAGRARGFALGNQHRTKFANDAMAAPGAETGGAEGGEGGGEMIPPEAMAAMQGGGGGGMPGGGEPDGDEGAGGGEVDPHVEELVKALEAEGITPEQLEAALAAEGGGEGGGEGGAPAGGAMPEPGPEKTGAHRQRQYRR